MRKYLFLFLFVIIAFSSWGQNHLPVIRLVVLSPEEMVENEIKQAQASFQIEALFTSELSEKYSVRLITPDADDPVTRAINNELKNNKISRDFAPDSKKRAKLRGANFMCVVQITKNNTGEYLFRADIADTQTGEAYGTATYPISGDLPVKQLDRQSLQRACRYLIARLGLGETTDNISAEEKCINGKALAWSLIPGMGLIQKGQKIGYSYLGGEIALCLGGVMVPELMRKNYINKRKHETNAHNRDVYTTRANSCRKVSIVCGTVAGIVYVANLVHSYFAPTTIDSKLHCSLNVMEGPELRDLALGVSLSYCF